MITLLVKIIFYPITPVFLLMRQAIKETVT